ncbi:resuscitation-promoting factor protein RpfC [Streptomyces glaucosporus]|uniref:Resuscitation-promoting factor protein RpfC n=1 Tax=Streptomyces glaucosporus TaxID=284044 RepID=A0ABN3HQ11_9ACTN
MLSGNGRHRRPRQAPAIFVTAGMTGAGIAMPLLGASGAQAADLDTWDRVAQCESGGLWSANTGNGYYGGLQLTQETWEEYGGTVYAERPDLASRSQQIAVAERILADQGPDAWPACGVNAGLRYDSTGEAPAIDPGDVLPSEEESSTPPAGRDGRGSGTESGGTEDSGKSGKSDGGAADGTAGSGDAAGGSGGAGRDAEADPSGGKPADGPEERTAGSGAGTRGDAADREAGTGRHRGERDPRELELEAAERTDGREAARDERSGPEAGRTDRSAERADGEGPLTADGGYRVQPGDSLSAIALEHDVRGGWTELYETNREVVGDDPDLILPGQELALG